MSLKAWNSYPDLNENGVEGLGVTTLKTMTKSTSAKNVSDKVANRERVSQSIELSDVIKVDYSEEKAVDASTFTEDKSSPAKSKLLTRKGQKSRSSVANLIKTKELRGSGGSSDTLNYEESIRAAKTFESITPEHSVTDSVGIARESQPNRKTSFITGSAPEFSGSWSIEVEDQKDMRTPKKSFIEDGGSSVLPMATGYFPRPKADQSLTSFLSSAQFSRANAELDRENAYFNISEAMIAAFEQAKCNRQLRLADEAAEESDADEEINNLKQRIRIRQRQ